MADPPPAPGHDEILVTGPAARTLCHSRQHARLGCLAEVLITFGELGTKWQRDALWQDCWGRSYAMCAECWDTTVRHEALQDRVGVRDLHLPAVAAAG